MKRSLVLSGLLLAAASAFTALPAVAQPEFPSPVHEASVPARQMPTPLKNIGYDQRLGESLPLAAPVRDETGRTVPLGSFFGARPVIFVLAYFRCPMLCNVVMDDLASSLKIVPFTPGKDYDIVVVSFDPADTPSLAAAKKDEVVARYNDGPDTSTLASSVTVMSLPSTLTVPPVSPAPLPEASRVPELVTPPSSASRMISPFSSRTEVASACRCC